MLDMSWGEVMLIGGVALIVIGPKDLPKALRTLGQVTTKVRRMAGDFQHQFNEAIREAELDEVKRDVTDLKRSVDDFRPSFNPVDTIRNEIKGAVEGRGSRKSEAMESTAPAAIAAATQDDAYRAPHGGSYDVPRPVEPIPPAASDASGAKPQDGPAR